MIDKHNTTMYDHKRAQNDQNDDQFNLEENIILLVGQTDLP